MQLLSRQSLSTNNNINIFKSTSTILSRAFSTVDHHHLPTLNLNRPSTVNDETITVDKFKTYPERETSLLSNFRNESSENLPYIVNKLISICSRSNLFDLGVQLHGTVLKLGILPNVYISSALVDFYGKCGKVESAHKVFDEMGEKKNVVSWNSLVSGYLLVGFPDIAIGLFLGMLREGVRPTEFGVSSVLVGCVQVGDTQLGGQIHGLSIKCGVVNNVVVGTGLVDMYGKCWSSEEARRVFDSMDEKNGVTWNAMISGYALDKLPYEGMFVFREMQRFGVGSDYVTCNTLLSSFCGKEHLDHCKQVHCHATCKGLVSNTYVQISLVSAYAECGCSLEEFGKVCLVIRIWDLIGWNAVIAGFSHLECGEMAVECFSKLRRTGVLFDVFTLTSVLRAIGIVSDIEVGRQVHALSLKLGSVSNLHVQNGLVSMYGRCGLIREAERVFFAMKERDLISWNSLLAGYSHHGNGQEVIELFEEMLRLNIEPDVSTLTCVLSACSHTGLVEKGLYYFDMLKKYGLCELLSLDLYASMVDMLSRGGYVDEAEAFINSMPIKPSPSVYKSLLSACKVHGKFETGKRASCKLLEEYPNDPATYILLSNSLATQGCWNESEELWKLMQQRRLDKGPGYSWVASSK